MMSKEAATDTATQLQTNAQKYFMALFTRPEANERQVTATYTTTGGTSMVVNGTADVPTSLLGVIGYNNIDREPFVHRQVGLERACAWRWCSTTPDRWPTAARSPR